MFLPLTRGKREFDAGITRCLFGRGHRVTVFTTIADGLESLWLPGYKISPTGEFAIDGVAVRDFTICDKRCGRRATGGEITPFGERATPAVEIDRLLADSQALHGQQADRACDGSVLWP